MLRPAFTQELANTLLAGKSVNLYAPHGRGRRQTLDDVQSLLDSVIVRKIDLKREQDKWKKWFEYTLIFDVQVIVIIHNIEYLSSEQKEGMQALRRFTLLCVSVLPFVGMPMLNIEIPSMLEA